MKELLKYFFLLSTLTIIIIFISLTLGPSKVLDIKSIFQVLFNGEIKDTENLELAKSILYEVRFPRVLLSFLVGGALSISGASLQSLFKNPLVSPDTIGLSAGSAFGAALAVAFPFLPIQFTSFIFGILSVFLTYFIAKIGGRPTITSFILSGVIVSGLFSSMLTILQFIVDPFKLQTIIYWLMGNIHTANLEKLKMVFLPIILCLIWLILYSFRMNVLALGEEEAKAVGLNPGLNRLMILIPTGFISASAISVAGIIGMIGLIIPHYVRMITGPDNRKIIPLSFFAGGNFLIVVDTFSRSLFNFELPIGVFTTIIGTPFFVYLVKTRIENFLGNA